MVFRFESNKNRMHSGLPLIRPSFCNDKRGLLGEDASLEGDILVGFFFFYLKIDINKMQNITKIA
jgi:hypothetical protein